MSNIIETPRPSLLSDQSLGVVQATAAVVAAHADEITAHFYPRMFAANPELLRVFNMGNQRGMLASRRSGRTRRRLLASAVGQPADACPCA